MSEINIDGNNMIFGRLASYVAKQALLGYTVNVYNCEDIVITGSKEKILEKYPKKAKFTGQMGKGPFRPRRSDLFLKRHMRNMVPYKQTRGKEAMERIRFHIGNPENKQNLQTIEKANVKKVVSQKYLKIKEIIKLLGGKV
ncbi:50S ribosomal protein L13 [Candidatus Woesearchaeota archaeon]|nr:50S ribosomal protein L13 [Candidatus Woesearchaeota archaeon]